VSLVFSILIVVINCCYVVCIPRLPYIIGVQADNVAGTMFTLPQPGQTLVLGITSLVIPWSWASWFCMQAIVALFVPLYASCVAFTPSCTDLLKSILLLSFSYVPNRRSSALSRFAATTSFTPFICLLSSA
jgi:hypothetical protein